MSTDARATIDAVWRIESARLIASIARIVRDVGLAEEIAQDAFVAALEQWPRSGVPNRPGAWLQSTARHRAIDLLRRLGTLERKQEELARLIDPVAPRSDVTEAYGDDVLALMFVACHPVLAPPARVALTLRLLGGLQTEEIARAFLVPPATVAQRIVRAKRTLAEARVPFEVPEVLERGPRLRSVLEVIYLIFNEGYAASAGEDWMRPALCEDALRLGRMLAALEPDAGEVHGLLALMEIQASRAGARTAPDGSPVLLLEQDRRRWDRLLVARGLAALARAESGGGTLGTYTLQAEIAAPHVTRALGTPRRRTGFGSPRYMTRSRRSPPRPSSSSTAPSPSRWRSARRRDSTSPTASSMSRPFATTTSCRACAATCWRSSAATRRRAPSSSARRR